MLANAIGRAGTLKEGALIKALEGAEHDSPLGETLTFKPSRIIKHQCSERYKLLQYQKGKVGIIWHLDLATADLVVPFSSRKGR